jgi:hypothetical protein
MLEQKTATSVPQVLLVCRLRAKQLPGGCSPTAGEIELENASPDVLVIETDMHPLQYLNLVVADASATVLSEGHYGDIFSPGEGLIASDWLRVRNTITSFLSWVRSRRRSGYRGRTPSRRCTNTMGSRRFPSL